MASYVAKRAAGKKAESVLAPLLKSDDESSTAGSEGSGGSNDSSTNSSHLSVAKQTPMQKLKTLAAAPFCAACLVAVMVAAAAVNLSPQMRPAVETAKAKALGNHSSNSDNLEIADGESFDPARMDGKWVHVGRNRTFDSPECCGWDGGKRGEKCARYISTVPLEAYKAGHHGNRDYPSLVGGLACSCSRFFDEYEWQSPGLAPFFDAPETCRVLGNRTVLFMGDSTVQQAASTVMNAFQPRGKRGEQCVTQIYFGASDTLDGNNHGAYNRGKRWDEQVREIDPDIVIVGVGAHIKREANDTLYIAVIDQLLTEMEAMNRRKPSMKFAWLTQHPAGCSKEIKFPENVTLAGETSEGLVPYNWGSFYQRDLLLMSRLHGRGVPYMDRRMLYSRTDAHICSKTDCKDCLHMCIPGPLDVMGRLFHKLLMDFESGN